MIAAGASSIRLGDGCRGSTPGRGVRQWTSAAVDRTLVNAGPEWSLAPPAQRNPLPSAPQVLSDVAHRGEHSARGLSLIHI